MREPHFVFVAGACALVLLVGGCGSADEQPPTASAIGTAAPETLRPVELPDLSGLADHAREQVRDRHAALMRAVERGDTPPGELSDLYGDTGLILMAAGYPEAPIVAFVNAVSLTPGDRRWPYYLGHLYRLRGKGAQAAELFARALELEPTDVPTLLWLGGSFLDQGRPGDADAVFERALSLEPDSAAALAGAGHAALAAQDYARAVDRLEQALGADPRALSLHYPLAMSYRGLGDQARADAHLERQSGGEPTMSDPLMDVFRTLLENPLSYEVQGVEAFTNGEWARAEAAFRAGLELEPDNPALRNRLATTLAVAGNTVDAEAEFEETLRRVPTYAPAHFGLGLLLDLTGRRLDAIDRFSAAVQYQPDYVEARLGLADALRLTGRAERSVPHYQRVVELDPRVAEAWVGGGDALIQLGRYEEAFDWLRDAGVIHPARPEIAGLLESVEAILDLTRALDPQTARP